MDRPRRARGLPDRSQSSARIVEHELELARDPALQGIGDRVPQLVGREDAVGARDVVEDECEMDARSPRVGLAHQQVGAVRPEEPASSSTAATTTAGSIVTTGTTGLLCMVLSPKLGSPMACRLPRPPQTIGTI